MSSTPIAELDIGLERTAAIRASTHAVRRWLLGERLPVLGLSILRWGLEQSEYKSNIIHWRKQSKRPSIFNLFMFPFQKSFYCITHLPSPSWAGKAPVALTGSPVFHESKHGYMCKRLESDQMKVNSLNDQTTMTRYQERGWKQNEPPERWVQIPPAPPYHGFNSPNSNTFVSFRAFQMRFSWKGEAALLALVSCQVYARLVRSLFRYCSRHLLSSSFRVASSVSYGTIGGVS